MRTELLKSIDSGRPACFPGLGTDVEEFQRFIKHLGTGSEPDALIFDVFSGDEIRLNLSKPVPVNYFTAGFSCKEAFFKALGKSWMNAPIDWKEIELLFDAEDGNEPYHLRFSSAIAERIEGLNGHNIRSRLVWGLDHVCFDIVINLDA